MTIRSSRHLAEPALGAMLDAVPTVDLAAELLPMMRSRLPWLPVAPADPARTSVIERLIPGSPGHAEVPIRLYRPVDASRPLGCMACARARRSPSWGMRIALTPSPRCAAMSGSGR